VDHVHELMRIGIQVVELLSSAPVLDMEVLLGPDCAEGGRILRLVDQRSCSMRKLLRHLDALRDRRGRRLRPSAPGARTPAIAANVGAKSMFSAR
jgi:hypothetical protein